jgi:hypothetical protein
MLTTQQQRSITDVESTDAAPEGTGVPEEARHRRIEVLDARTTFETYDIVRLRELCEERKRIWDAWGRAHEEFSRSRSAETLATVQKAERDFIDVNATVASIVATVFALGIGPSR